MPRQTGLNQPTGLDGIPHSLNQLNHSCVRDLAWCLTSPAIYHLSLERHRSADLSDNPCNDPPRLWSWLHRLDQQPAPLYQAIAQQRSHRIGIYFETLYGFALEQLLQPAGRHYALAVRQQGNRLAHTTTQTVGEYDLLHRVKGRSSWCHTELSLKFYLGIPSATGTTDWVGLNRKDRLFEKRDKILQQQLQLSRHPQARLQLKQRQIQVGSRLGIIRGRLFYPFETPQLTAPAGAQGDHLRGWWIKAGLQQRLTQPQHRTDLLSAASQIRLFKLSRRQWLAPLSADDIARGAAQFLAAAQGVEAVASEQPEMVARLISTPDGWREHDRGVLVPDDWV